MWEIPSGKSHTVAIHCQMGKTMPVISMFYGIIVSRNYFRKVDILNETVCWPHEQDICPDTLYLDSVKQES
jgi:hypothetical protein